MNAFLFFPILSSSEMYRATLDSPLSLPVPLLGVTLCHHPQYIYYVNNKICSSTYYVDNQIYSSVVHKEIIMPILHCIFFKVTICLVDLFVSVPLSLPHSIL